ncbi:hypothetical protein ACFFIF_06330 [Vagococcus entomophilus]|uniref:Glyoxalase n=1 Tax=Vagococcus entomophilus TaxID=1160095 RepID=A0A430AFF0_9ENTE|nr:hypothetical protein [Vagococcus entomophilus]RSU06448.1 hypothetical protein CBF30_09340 [Vagococcus entomophilus]
MENKERKSNSYNPKEEPKIWFIIDNVMELYTKLEKENSHFFCEPYKVEKGIAMEFTSPLGNQLYISDCSLLKKS